MALNTNALLTVEALETELCSVPGAQVIRFETLINAASSMIESYVNRKLFNDSAISESVGGFGGFKMQLLQPPIVGAITSITFGDNGLVDADNYEVFSAEAGILFAPAGWNWTTGISFNATLDPIAGTERKRYTVVYDGGFVTGPQAAVAGVQTLPSDIEYAATMLAAQLFRQTGKNLAIKSEKLGDWSVNYGSGAANPSVSASGMPDMVSAILDRYKFPLLG